MTETAPTGEKADIVKPWRDALLGCLSGPMLELGLDGTPETAARIITDEIATLREKLAGVEAWKAEAQAARLVLDDAGLLRGCKMTLAQVTATEESAFEYLNARAATDALPTPPAAQKEK
jgi:hypothetical protein